MRCENRCVYYYVELETSCIAMSQVKVLQNKPGTAMAHMDSPAGAKNAIHHLHGRKLLGETLELK